MNAGRLTDFVRTFLKVDNPQAEMPNTAHVLDLLNQAQDEMSAELGLPTKLLTVTSQTTPFSLPSDVRPTDPILEIRYAKNDNETTILPVLSIERAGVEFPNWQQDTRTDDPRAAIYSTAVDSIPDVYVYPNPGAADYFILYKVKPTDLSDLDDIPFNGDLARYHIALAHFVVFMLNGNDQRFAIYRNFVNDAAGVRNRGPLIRKNLAYDMKGRWY